MRMRRMVILFHKPAVHANRPLAVRMLPLIGILSAADSKGL